MYETFFLVSEIMDHSFEYHLAVTRVWAELARSLADSLILPIGVVDTAEKITGSIATLKGFYEDQMAEQGITWGKCSQYANISQTLGMISAVDSLNPEVGTGCWVGFLSCYAVCGDNG